MTNAIFGLLMIFVKIGVCIYIYIYVCPQSSFLLVKAPYINHGALRG